MIMPVWPYLYRSAYPMGRSKENVNFVSSRKLCVLLTWYEFMEKTSVCGRHQTVFIYIFIDMEFDWKILFIQKMSGQKSLQKNSNILFKIAHSSSGWTKPNKSKTRNSITHCDDSSPMDNMPNTEEDGRMLLHVLLLWGLFPRAISDIYSTFGSSHCSFDNTDWLIV